MPALHTLTARVFPVANLDTGGTYDRVDFRIDGVGVQDLLLGGRVLGERESLPLLKGTPLAYFSGFEAETFLTGYNPCAPGVWAHIAPVLVCECGESGCGSVATQVTVVGNYVNWKGFRWGNPYAPPGHFYDTHLRVFAREPYEKLMHSLVASATWLYSNADEQT